MGVDAMGLRLARRPATVRVGAVVLRAAVCGRVTVGSGGGGGCDIVGVDEGEGGGGCRGGGGMGGSMRRMEILIEHVD